jgi:hypothetical protein
MEGLVIVIGLETVISEAISSNTPRDIRLGASWLKGR